MLVCHTRCHDNSLTWLTILGFDTIIEMVDKRATIVANPGWYSRKWGKRLQKDFKTVLDFFEKSTPEQRSKFKAGEAEGLPAKECLSRILKVTRKV